jgi:HK97 family phage major capsid protein
MAAEAGRELTDEEVEQLDELRANAARWVKLANANEPLQFGGPGRRTVPAGMEPQNRPSGPNPGHAVPATPGHSVPATPVDRRGGFRTLGDFAQATFSHYARNDNGATTRLMNAATSYGSEGVGGDGGFAVPPEFTTQIWQKINTQENLMTRCATMPMASNNMTFPKDETTPWQTSGGILAYWESEAATVAQSKPSWLQDTIRLAKLMALVPISEELLEDAPAIEGWLNLKAPQKMVARINTAIIRGTGAGQPLGILNSPSVISVSAATSQDAGTVWFQNVTDMWGRMYAPLRAGAIWLINQDVEPFLQRMAFDPEASTKVPVYLGPNGIAGSPYATLQGRPVVPIEPCSAAGTQGDIILVNLDNYIMYTKAGQQEPRQDVSMHLFFDQGLMAFRFTFRLNGTPLWTNTITRENGSNTLSWAVTLAARP